MPGKWRVINVARYRSIYYLWVEEDYLICLIKNIIILRCILLCILLRRGRRHGLNPRVSCHSASTSTMLFRSLFCSITKYIITASNTMRPQQTLYSQHVVVVNGTLNPASTKDKAGNYDHATFVEQWAMSNVFRLSEYLPCPYSMIHSKSTSWLLINTPCTYSMMSIPLTWDYFLLTHSHNNYQRRSNIKVIQ